MAASSSGAVSTAATASRRARSASPPAGSSPRSGGGLAGAAAGPGTRSPAGDGSTTSVPRTMFIPQARPTSPAYARTAVQLVPAHAGEFGFACGMNMVRGTLVVEPSPAGERVPGPAAAPANPPPDLGDEPAGGEAERARRLAVAAVLTAPLLLAAMAGGLVPVGPLADHRVQLVLVLPVMLYSGWPIHRTGWLSLAHRSA